MHAGRLSLRVIPRSLSRSTRPAVRLESIVEAVARHNGVPVTHLEPRLYDVVDPDALHSLVNSAPSRSNRPIEVRFEYAGCYVTVGSDGTLAVE